MAQHVEEVGPDGGDVGGGRALYSAILLLLLARRPLFVVAVLGGRRVVEPRLVVPHDEQRPPRRQRLLEHVLVQDIHIPPEDGVDSVAAHAVHAPPVLAPFPPGRRRRGEDGGVAEVALGAHDGVGARGREAPLDVAVLEDVAVGEEDGLRGQVLAQVADVRPVGDAGQVALLLPPAAVDGEDARAGRQDVLRVGQRRLFGVEDADLGGHGDGQVRVEGVDHVVDELLVLLQECAVVALARDALGTAQVEVDGVAVRRDLLRGVEQVLGVVGAELHEQGAVEAGVPVEV